MTTFPRITCAVCKKPVEAIEWWDDYARDDRAVQVYCHGATDQMRIDFRRLSSADLDALSQAEGVAFTTPAISHGGKSEG